MNKPEALAALAFTGLGIYIEIEAMKFPYLIEHVPGPGFLPRWIAGGLVLTGLVLIAQALRPRAASQEPPEWPDAGGWRRVGLVAGMLAISLLLLKPLGFLVTATIFLLVVIFGLGVRSWLMLATVPVLSATGLYLMFAVWLQVPLPRGVLEYFG